SSSSCAPRSAPPSSPLRNSASTRAKSAGGSPACGRAPTVASGGKSIPPSHQCQPASHLVAGVTEGHHVLQPGPYASAGEERGRGAEGLVLLGHRGQNPVEDPACRGDRVETRARRKKGFACVDALPIRDRLLEVEERSVGRCPGTVVARNARQAGITHAD